MSKFIKNLDFLGEPINFKIDKKDSFRTILGGLLSIGLYISFISMLYFFGQEIIYKENPVGYSKKENLPFDKLSISKNQFLFGVTLFDFETKLLDFNEYFFLSFSYSLFNQDSDIDEEIDLDVVRCDDDKVKVDTLLEKGINNLTNYYCPDLTKVKDKDLYGNWDNKISTRIYIKVSLCNKNKQKCKNLEEIEKKFEKKLIFLNVIFPEVEYSITNYEKPLTTKLKSKISILNSKQFILENFFFSKIKLTDDHGILFNEEKITNAIGITYKELHFDFRDEKKKPEFWENVRDQYVYWGEVSYSNTEIEHERSYMKLLDIIGNVYGISEILVFFVCYFYLFYSKASLNSYYCMRLLYLEEDVSIDLNGIEKAYSDKERKESRKKVHEFFAKGIINNLKLKEDINKNKTNRKDFFLNNNKISNPFLKDCLNEIDNEKGDIKEKEIEKEPKNSINEVSNTNKFKSFQALNLNSRIRNFQNQIENKNNKIEIDIDIINSSKSKKSEKLKNFNKIEFDGIEEKIEDGLNQEISLRNKNNFNKENKNSKDLKELNEFKESEDEELENSHNRKYTVNKESEIRPLLEFIINKFRALKNTMTFNVFSYCWTYLFNKKGKKKINYNNLFMLFGKKLDSQLDVFYYLQNNKKLDLIEDIMFTNTEKKLINLISKKFHKVSLDCLPTKKSKTKETNEEIIKYFFANRNESESKKTRKLIESFIH